MIEQLPKVWNAGINEEKTYEEMLAQIGIRIVEPTYNELFMRVEMPEGWRVQHGGGYWSYLLDEKGRERGNMFTKLAFWDADAFFGFTKRFSISGEVADYDEKAFEPKPEKIKQGYDIKLVDVAPEDYRFDGRAIVLRKGLDVDECIFSNGRIKRQVKSPKYVPNPDYHPLQRYEKYSQPFHFEVLDHDKTVLFASKSVQTEFAYTKEKHWDFFHHRDTVREQAMKECLDWLEAHYPDWLNPLSYWD